MPNFQGYELFELAFLIFFLRLLEFLEILCHEFQLDELVRRQLRVLNQVLLLVVFMVRSTGELSAGGRGHSHMILETSSCRL